MIRRTLNNMEKAVQLIMAKGYDHTAANEIAMQCFEDAERAKNGMSIEWWIDQIANKEEWVQTEKY